MSPFEHARKLIRFDHWWWAKIPPLLAVVYLVLAQQPTQARSAPVLIGAYLLTIFCIAAYGHVINDAFDIRVDRLAGKPNGMARVSRSGQVLLCVGLAGAAGLPSVLLDFPFVARMFVILNLAWPTIYSVPPMRLKERGLLGVLCDAAGSHITPTLMALAVFSPPWPPLAFSVLITMWAAALGIKGILHHQIRDQVTDKLAGVRTFVADRQSESIASFLPFYNLAIEVPVSGILSLVVWPSSPLVAVSFGLYCLVELIKYRCGFQFALSADKRTYRASIPFANELNYTAWLPLAAVVQLAVNSPPWAWMVAAHVVTLQQPLRVAALDVSAALRAATLQPGRRLRQYVRSRSGGL